MCSFPPCLRCGHPREFHMDDPARSCDTCECPKYRHRLGPADLWWAFRAALTLMRRLP